MGVGEAFIVNGNSEESSDPEGLDIGGDGFQVTPERFFAGIDAKDGLKTRIREGGNGATRVNREGVESAVLIVSFEGKVKDSATLD